MFHYFNAITNVRGDALIGYFVKAVDTVSGDAAAIYADESATPIISVSGVDNAAEVDSDGNVSFYIEGGEYHLDIYGTDATSLIKRISNVPMSSAVDVREDIESGALSEAGLADRIALAAIDGTDNAKRYLAESGREGWFVWDGSDLGSRVSADVNQGIYVAPASDATGASGAWVRKFQEPVDPRWWGLSVSNTGAENSAAIDAMFACLRSRAVEVSTNYQAIEAIRFAASESYDLASTIELTNGTFVLEGGATGFDVGKATKFTFPAGVTGIRVQAYNTSGANTKDSVTHRGGDGSIIRGIALFGGYTSVDGEYHGIQLRARAVIENVFIHNFEGDGIHIAAGVSNANGADPPCGNANNWRIVGGRIQHCRNGLFTDGADVNAGSCTSLDCTANRSWGIYDSSFLGNTYVACHTATNTIGAYKADDASAQNVFIGCYSESDQPGSTINVPALVVGGLHAAALGGTGGYLSATQGAPTTTQAFVKYKSDATNGGYGFATIGEGSNQTTLASQYHSVLMTETFTIGLGTGGILKNDLWANFNTSTHCFRITGNLTTEQYGTGTAQPRVFQPTRFALGSYGSARRMDYASAVPSSGTHGQGEIVFNNAPTQGGIFGWSCYTTGTPGSWTADYVNARADPSIGVGYVTGAGGAVTQATSRTTGVTLNKVCGTITLVSAAGSASWQTFTVTNSTVAANDTIRVCQQSGTDLYQIHVTNVAAGSFKISFATTGGTTTEQPVFNFSVIKGVAA
jgi:hypothetical protein